MKHDPRTFTDQASSRYLRRVMMTMADDMGKTSLGVIKGDEDSWQFSYLDVITLLFAAFAVLLALYGNQVSKQKEVLEGMKARIQTQSESRFNPVRIPFDQITSPPPKTLDDTPRDTDDQRSEPAPAPVEEQTPPSQKALEQSALDVISRRVAEQGLEDMVALETQKGGLIITMKETLLFPSGKATLSAQGATWIREIAPTLEFDATFISVEGHTDNVPINTERFPSNWELSAARASSVVRELVAAGVPSDKLRAIGYADSRPIGYNAFPSGREQNRRVQIKLNFSGASEN